MRRSYAVPLSLALLLTLPMVNPHSASADPGPTLVGYQQSTSYVIQRALSQRGVPFLYGGGNAAGPTRGTGLKANVVGFDASGLIQYAYAGAGLKMPRTSGEQCNVGRKVRARTSAPRRPALLRPRRHPKRRDVPRQRPDDRGHRACRHGLAGPDQRHGPVPDPNHRVLTGNSPTRR